MEDTRWEHKDRTIDLWYRRTLIRFVVVFRWTRPRINEPDGLVKDRNAY